MKITEIKKGSALVLNIEGRLDTTNYGILESKLNDIYDHKPVNIIMDCKGLDYVSSSGLRVLLMFLKKAKASKVSFALCNLQDSIKEIFDISGFTSIFEIYDNQEEALEKY